MDKRKFLTRYEVDAILKEAEKPVCRTELLHDFNVLSARFPRQ